MKIIEFQTEARDAFGKKESRAGRRCGRVPGTIYGGGETLHFWLDAKALKALIYTPNSYLVDLQIDGRTERAVMREVQFHPVREEMLHIDFYRVQENKPVAIELPVRLVGNSEGVKAGGKLVLSKRKLMVSGLAENLPDELVVDITDLDVGKSIFVGDLKFDHLTLLSPATTAVCAVRITRASRGAAAPEAK